jgi:NDP-4-keto-2,6-dideoxyhexose 3-C-methyltransferase
MEALLKPHGLEIVDMELRTVNGGSFRLYVMFKDRRPPTPRVTERWLEEEDLLHPPYGPSDQAFTTFAAGVQRSRAQLQELLGAYQHNGGVVDLLGASTKGNTLLQYCGIDHQVIRQAWERSEEKHGRYVGVSGIPIVSDEHGRLDPPSALLSTIWQFREGLLKREAPYLQAGGRIIFPLPQLEVVSNEG